LFGAHHVFCIAWIVTSGVQGLCDALLEMQEGAHWEVVVPPQLGYGGRKHGAIA
jgi:FKBP-type peptidyl-prolyl cis-trans isomerase